MVHTRLNERDLTRNQSINFITALAGPTHDEALTRLKQLAALFKPIVAEYGFSINSLEEYEYNTEFLGRNWNAGDTIEMVLRGKGGHWLSMGTVVRVFSHELAHIKHMNHLPAHGRLTAEINAKAVELMRKGYFGDGFWSAGTRLADGSRQEGDAVMAQELGQVAHLCGGASKGARRPTTRRPAGSSTKRSGPASAASALSKRRGFTGPSLRTGPQTAKNTSKIASKRMRKALPGVGHRLGGDAGSPQAPLIPPLVGMHSTDFIAAPAPAADDPGWLTPFGLGIPAGDPGPATLGANGGRAGTGVAGPAARAPDPSPPNITRRHNPAPEARAARRVTEVIDLVDSD